MASLMCSSSFKCGVAPLGRMAKSCFSMAQFLWFSDFPLVKESVLLSCSVANDPQNVCHNSWSIIFRFSLTTHTHSCECVCVAHCSCWWLPRWLFHLRCMCPCVDSSRTQCTFTYWTFACTACKHTYAHMHSTAACAVMWQLHSNCNICCCCCTASAVPAVAGSCTTMDSKSSSCNCNWQCNLAVGQQHVPQAMQFLCSQLPKRRTTHTHSRMPDNWPGYPWSCNKPVAIDAGVGNWNWLRPQGYIRLMMV